MPAFDNPANYAFDSYDSLVAAINDWLDREDLTGVAQQMIALAEKRMEREIAPLFSESTGSIVCTDGIGALPADCSQLVRVVYGTRTIPQISVGAAFDIPAGSVPVAYTVEATGIRLWPAVSATVTVLYQPKIIPLSDGTPSNALLDAHPDIYLYGSLMFAEGYLANDQRAAMFKGLWDEAIAEAKRYFVRQKFVGPLVPRMAFTP